MRPPLVITLLLAGCAIQPPTTSTPIPPKANVPKGAMIEASGFATIRSAPPASFKPPAPPPPQEDMFQKFARENGMTLDQARGAINGSPELNAEASRLAQLFRTRENATFVEWRMERVPHVVYMFTFTKNGPETLARYTKNPNLRARTGGMTRAELEPLFNLWMAQFEKHRLFWGGSIDAEAGEISIDPGVSASEFAVFAKAEGWQLPANLGLNFAQPKPEPAVDEKARRFVRFFAQSDRSPSTVLTVANFGKIILDDGCFRLEDRTKRGPLVLFGRELTLTIDDQGYLAFPSARVGEEMVWSGGGTAIETESALIPLRAQCGAWPVVYVGEPGSLDHFNRRYQQK